MQLSWTVAQLSMTLLRDAMMSYVGNEVIVIDDDRQVNR